SIFAARPSAGSSAPSSSITVRMPTVDPPSGTESLPVNGEELPPPDFGRCPDAGQQLAVEVDDLVGVGAVEVLRVVQEGVRLAADRRPDLLLVALHVLAAIREAAAGVLPARLAAVLARLDEEQDFGVGPGLGDEREQTPVDHAGLGRGVAVERRWQQ